MLSESLRNYLVQAAADKVIEGTDPDPEAVEDPEAMESFNNTVKEMQDYIDKYGEEAFHKVSWDVGYSY